MASVKGSSIRGSSYCSQGVSLNSSIRGTNIEDAKITSRARRLVGKVTGKSSYVPKKLARTPPQDIEVDLKYLDAREPSGFGYDDVFRGDRRSGLRIPDLGYSQQDSRSQQPQSVQKMAEFEHNNPLHRDILSHGPSNEQYPPSPLYQDSFYQLYYPPVASKSHPQMQQHYPATDVYNDPPQQMYHPPHAASMNGYASGPLFGYDVYQQQSQQHFMQQQILRRQLEQQLLVQQQAIFQQHHLQHVSHVSENSSRNSPAMRMVPPTPQVLAALAERNEKTKDSIEPESRVRMGTSQIANVGVYDGDGYDCFGDCEFVSIEAPNLLEVFGDAPGSSDATSNGGVHRSPSMQQSLREIVPSPIDEVCYRSPEQVQECLVDEVIAVRADSISLGREHRLSSLTIPQRTSSRDCLHGISNHRNSVDSCSCEPQNASSGHSASFDFEEGVNSEGLSLRVPANELKFLEKSPRKSSGERLSLLSSHSYQQARLSESRVSTVQSSVEAEDIQPPPSCCASNEKETVNDMEGFVAVDRRSSLTSDTEKGRHSIGSSTSRLPCRGSAPRVSMQASTRGVNVDESDGTAVVGVSRLSSVSLVSMGHKFSEIDIVNQTLASDALTSSSDDETEQFEVSGQVMPAITAVPTTTVVNGRDMLGEDVSAVSPSLPSQALPVSSVTSATGKRVKLPASVRLAVPSASSMYNQSKTSLPCTDSPMHAQKSTEAEWRSSNSSSNSGNSCIVPRPGSVMARINQFGG